MSSVSDVIIDYVRYRTYKVSRCRRAQKLVVLPKQKAKPSSGECFHSIMSEFALEITRTTKCFFTGLCITRSTLGKLNQTVLHITYTDDNFCHKNRWTASNQI